MTRDGWQDVGGRPARAASADVEAVIAEIARPDAGGFSILLEGPAVPDRRMLAEMIADAADRRLFGVDHRRVSGRSIGETEKNLRVVFAEATALGAILFFDEAEALFGRRSAAVGVEERLAIGAGGLLLRMMGETEAVVILATTLRSALDPALVRTARAVLNVA